MMLPLPFPDGGGDSPLMGMPNPIPYMEPWQIAVLGGLIGLLVLWILAHVLLNLWRNRQRPRSSRQESAPPTRPEP